MSSLVLLPEQAQHKHTPTLARIKAIKRYPDTTVLASKEQLECLQVRFCDSSCHNNHNQLKLLIVWTIMCISTSGSHRTNSYVRLVVTQMGRERVQCNVAHAQGQEFLESYQKWSTGAVRQQWYAKLISWVWRSIRTELDTYTLSLQWQKTQVT